MQKFHQSILSFATSHVKGVLRGAAVLCLSLLPLASVHAQVEKGAVYEGDTLLWRCQLLGEAGTYVDGPSHTMHFQTLAKPVTKPQESVAICKGDTLIWRCRQLAAADTYNDTEVYADFPDLDKAYYSLKLSVVEPKDEAVEPVTICEGDTLIWHCLKVYEQGLYYDTLKSLLCSTCDSIRYTLDLKIASAPVVHSDIVLADGDSLIWACYQIGEEGMYRDTVYDGSPCPVRIDELKVTYEPIVPEDKPTEYATLCEGDTLLWRCLQVIEAGEYGDTIKSLRYPDKDSVRFSLSVSMNEPIKHLPEDEIHAYLNDTVLWRCQTIICDEMMTDKLYTDTVFDGKCAQDIYYLKLTVGCAEPTKHPEEVISAFVRDTVLWRCKTIICDRQVTDSIVKDTIYGDKCATDVYTLKLTIGCPEMKEAEPETHTICDGETYPWHGQELTEAKTYYATDQDIFGCDSMHYTLTLNVLKPTLHPEEVINAFVRDTVLWRCKTIICDRQVTDSIVKDTIYGDKCATDVYTLKLTIGCPEMKEAEPETHTICDGETYPWHGQELTEAKTYYATDQDIFGCDSMHYTLTLNVLKPTLHPEEVINAFVRDTVLWRCKTIICDRQVTDSIIKDTIYGDKCATDVYTLKLTIGCPEMKEAEPETHTICDGETYPWHGQELTEANTYYATDQDIFGCDSMHYTLTLNVLKPTLHPEEVINAFVRDTVLWRCKTIICDRQVTDSIIKDTIYGDKCATDVYTLKLTIGCPEMKEAEPETHTICDGETYPWHGQELKEAKTYYATDQDIFGCDSMHYTLTLKVIKPTSHPEEVINAFVRDTVLWRCKTIICDKIVSDKIITDEGVDGETGCVTDIYTLKLNVDCPKMQEAAPFDTTICAGDVYTWRGIDCDTAGTYYDTVQSVIYPECDSIRFTLNLNVQKVEIEEHETVTINPGEIYPWREHTIVGKDLCQDSIIGDTIWTVEPVCPKEIYVLHLNVVCRETKLIEDSLTFCGHQNDTILWHCQLLTESGTYEDIVPSMLNENCDSIHYVYYLTFHKDSIAPIEEVTLCNNDSIFWNDQWIKEPSGDQPYSYWTYYPLTPAQEEAGLEQGCDSVFRQLKVNVRTMRDTVLYDTICTTTKYTWHSWRDTTVNIPDDVETPVDGYFYYDTARYAGTTDCDSMRYTMRVYVNRVGKRHFYTYDSLCVNDGDVPSSYQWTIADDHDRVKTIVLTGKERTGKGHYVVTRRDTVYYLPTSKGYECDSAYYELQLHVFRPMAQDSIADTTLCYTDVMEWFGETYDKKGTYHHTLKYAGTNCDSLYCHLNLMFRDEPKKQTDNPLIKCYRDSDPIQWRGKHITESGIYTDSTYYEGTQCVNQYYEVEVTILKPSFDTVYYSFCQGGTFMWEGHINHALSAEGWYFDTIPYKVIEGGCDSLIHCLYLTELAPITMPVDTQYICAGQQFEWFGEIYNQTGTYYHTEKYAVWGCDSAYYTLQLEKQKPLTTQKDTLYMCNGSEVVWDLNGRTYSHAGLYYDTIRSPQGCDQIAGELRVVERTTTTAQPEYVTIYQTQSYTWRDGKQYSEEGTYEYLVYFDRSECVDTIYSLTLSVKDIEYTEVEVSEIVCAGDTYKDHQGADHLITEHTAWSDTVRVEDETGALVDVVTKYDINIYRLDMPEGLLKGLKASCGMPMSLRGADNTIEQYILTTENYAPGAHAIWEISENGGNWVTLDTTVALDGNDTIVAIRCTVHSECGDVQTEQSFKVSMTAYMWMYEIYNMLPVISMYNGTVLMVDVDAVEQKIGWRPEQKDVQWYRQEGELDDPEHPSLTDPQDVALNVWGYYLTPTDPAEKRGEYYAVMKYNKPLPSGTCGMLARTMAIGGNSAITLNPNVPNASAPVTVGGDGPYIIRVMDMFNNLVGEYTNTNAFNAPAVSGTYIVQICDLSGAPLAYRTLIVYP